MFTPYATNCVLCLPPTSASCMYTPSDANIYSYMPHAFKYLFSIKKKKDHYDIGSGICICQNKHTAQYTSNNTLNRLYHTLTAV
jgi:hypothetical protein